eukprot:TRINITY_DN12412_c0_g1_i1.p1 TRINITY_DN12412_c0_g1~~TRINITY_DN12412_c0_g1_i1.p1  ORF type:complete len:1247 (-),score=285.50 TRINITY_DN12412_c0_g1_i1:61-3801(-)
MAKEGQNCFFLSPERSWVQGVVVTVGKEPPPKTTYICKDKEEEVKLLEQDVYPLNNLAILDEDADDLLLLPELHEAFLLHALQRRYMRNVVYTYLGPLIVAMNPFNYNIPWYKDDMMPSYMAEGSVIQKNKPHTWCVAHNTYYEMLERANQCVLVSGESGAGKTEAVKIVIKYLGAISCLKGTEEQREVGRSVGSKILRASPILESFGNAKTVRNDNSSRFGKFLQVQFDAEGFVIGAFTINYLLEKSRVVTAGPGERIYHAFYQVAKGKDAAKYGLDSPQAYASLNAGNCLAIDGVDDAVGEDLSYLTTCKAMDSVGMTEQEKDAVWRIVAAILHIGRLKFGEANGEATFDGPTKQYLEKACELWRLPADKVGLELLQTISVLRGESITKKHTKAMAQTTLDSLIKALYVQLFDWLVAKINATSNRTDGTVNWIGLLDIFGFEDFQVNSFEQLCINLANETLQQHYNVYIFERDVEECKAEGINVTKIKFEDNKPTVELLTQKMGVFALLDEECSLGKGSDLSFLKKLEETFAKKHPNFEKKPLQKTSFTIKHYAGSVSYEVADFLEKNRASLKDELKLLFRTSACPLVKEMLPEPVDKRGRAPTVSGTFREQIGALMAMINSTNPHWIRCIKPHPAKKPLLFHPVKVMEQLRCSGVLDTVKQRKAGYPIRIPHRLFMTRYRLLSAQKPDQADPAGSCRAILSALNYDIDLCQIGTTKVFMRAHTYNDIEERKRQATTKYAVTVQSAIRWRKSNFIRQNREVELNKVILEYFDGCIKKRTDLVSAEEPPRAKLIAEEIAAFNKLMEDFRTRTRDLMKEIYEMRFQRLIAEETGARTEVLSEAHDEWQKIMQERREDHQRVKDEMVQRERERRRQARLEEEKRRQREKREMERQAKEAREREEQMKRQAIMEAAREIAQKERQRAEAALRERRERQEKEKQRFARAQDRREQFDELERAKNMACLEAHWEREAHGLSQRKELAEDRQRAMQERAIRTLDTTAEARRRKEELSKWTADRAELLSWETDERDHVKEVLRAELEAYRIAQERERIEERNRTEAQRQHAVEEQRRQEWEFWSRRDKILREEELQKLRTERQALHQSLDEASEFSRIARRRAQEEQERAKWRRQQNQDDARRRQVELEEARRKGVALAFSSRSQSGTTDDTMTPRNSTQSPRLGRPIKPEAYTRLCGPSPVKHGILGSPTLAAALGPKPGTSPVARSSSPASTKSSLLSPRAPSSPLRWRI